MTVSAPIDRAPPLRPREQMRLAVEVLRAYVLVRRMLNEHKLTSVVEQLRGSADRRHRALLPHAAVDGVRLGNAVTRTLRLIPTASRCLTRSLVLMRLLAVRGVTGELVIAVMPGDRSQLDAHAWIELEGRPLLAPAATHGRLLVL